jgi:anthranilate synthase component 2
MLFLLDNYDSFTYNLVQYLGELGAEVEVARNDAVTVDEIAARKPSGIVLSPGPGRPENAGIMEELVRSLMGQVPILGVCLGHQAIAQVLGGRIDYAPTLMHGKTSEVKHDGSTLFKGIPSPLVATRYHSLVVDPASKPKVLRRTAWAVDRVAADGVADVIMAVEHVHLPLWGLQFHPESIMTPCGKDILRNFLEVL